MMTPVNIYIHFGVSSGTRRSLNESPSCMADVFVEGLGKINIETSLSKDLTDRLTLEVVAVVRKRLGMTPFAQTIVIDD